MFEAINWPEEMAPSRCPIHFTNELEVAASPGTIWSLLVDTRASPSFYPGVKHVQLLDGHDSLRLGTQFETNLPGQDVVASVPEFEPMTRIAWYGGPKDSEAYHSCIITRVPKGCHLRIELAKKAPDAFWLTHEKLLADLAKSRGATRRLSPRRNSRSGKRPSGDCTLCY